jgi:hypothetical protein
MNKQAVIIIGSLGLILALVFGILQVANPTIHGLAVR